MCTSTAGLIRAAEFLQTAEEPCACQQESITPADSPKTPIQSFVINTTTRLSSKINSFPFFLSFSFSFFGHEIVFDEVHSLLMGVNFLRWKCQTEGLCVDHSVGLQSPSASPIPCRPSPDITSRSTKKKHVRPHH